MRPVLAVAAALVVVCCLAAPARAADSDVLYDPRTVTTVDLSMSDAALQALRAEPKEYADAGLSLTLPDGRVVGPYAVGVKTKGNATWLPIDQKAGLKVKFAHSVKKQKVLGLKGLTLNNMRQDDSFVRETVSYALFRAAGVPAARTGYAYVRLNGVGKGVYLDLETYDEISMGRLFPGGTQHLYEGESTADFAQNKRGPFGVEEGDEDDVSDLDTAIGAAAGWPANASASFDRTELLKMWAAEQFVAHFDGYSPNDAWYAPNNFYVHSDPAGRFSMLPSGMDQTLINWNKDFANSAMESGATGRPILWWNCKANPSCLADFKTTLRTVSKTAQSAEIGVLARTAADTVGRWRGCAAQDTPNRDRWLSVYREVTTFLGGRRQEAATWLGDGAQGAPTPIAVPSGTPSQAATCPAPAVPVTPTPTPTPSPTPTATPTTSPSPTPTATATPAAPAPEAPAAPAPGTPAGSGDAPAGGVAGESGSGARTCVVPRLRGATLQRSRKLLRASGCRPGAVVRRGDGKRVKRGGWRVRTSKPGAGARRAGEAKIVLLLVPKR